MVLSGMVLSGMVLSGMALSGMALSGMALSGMALSGMALLPLHRLPADIAAAETFRPFDPVDRLIGPRLRLGHRLGSRGDMEHAPAVGGDLAAVGLGAGMENFNAFDFASSIQPFDDRAALVIARIALRRHHHGQRRVW